MRINPCAKVNLGLNVVERRKDGYHNLETVFYPVPLYDTLEIEPLSDKKEASATHQFTMSGIDIEGKPADNLVMKAYRLLAEKYHLPPLKIHLHKGIPSQAGMGGGSSDAAYMIRLLNKQFLLGISIQEMQKYAAKIGADCAFFIQSKPAYAEGIGDNLSLINEQDIPLKGHFMAIIKPNIAVSTRDAYAQITPCQPTKCCLDIVRQPIETWHNHLVNDFEEPVFNLFPELRTIKRRLYEAGALYAQMTGSGSAIFAIFKENPGDIYKLFPDTFNHIVAL